MDGQRGWMIGAMLGASLVGGAASNVLLTTRLAAQGGDVVTASQVNLVDGSGRLTAVLSGSDERGLTALTFYGPDRSVRAVLGVESDGTPALRFADPAGAVQLSATVRGSDASVTVGDEAARSAVFGSLGGTPVLGLSHDGRARLQLELGTGGQPSLNLQGEPTLNLLGAPGQRAIGLSVDADGAPFLSLYDPSGAPRLVMGAVQGTTVMNLGDGTRPRLVLGVTDQGEGTLGFYDAEGTLVRLEGAEPSP
ncbi:MAG: hypothetical protein VX427_07885 [Acidobacteriota bacterium]|nr:hypothetical protein [Acidobacteriota bacterium]